MDMKNRIIYLLQKYEFYSWYASFDVTPEEEMPVFENRAYDLKGYANVA